MLLLGALAGLFILVGDQIMTLGENLRTDDVQALIDAGDPVTGQAPLKWLWNNIFAGGVVAIGNLLGILGELGELATPLVGAVGGGFLLSSLSSDFLATPIRKLPLAPAHGVGLGLGVVAGAILMGAMGWLGLQAALLGVLPMLVAGILGGQILLSLYKILTPSGDRKRFDVNRADDAVRQAVFAVGFVIAALATWFFMDLDRQIVNGIIPQRTTSSVAGVDIIRYIYENALIGAVLGGVLGVLNGTHATFPLGATLYNVSRAALNTIRSIEPLIMGLVFVIWVGIGPFAGVLALTLHSIAALGKLYSEQVENIDPGPSRRWNRPARIACKRSSMP